MRRELYFLTAELLSLMEHKIKKDFGKIDSYDVWLILSRV